MTKAEFLAERKENLKAEYAQLKIQINPDTNKKNTRNECYNILAKKHGLSSFTISAIVHVKKYNAPVETQTTT